MQQPSSNFELRTLGNMSIGVIFPRVTFKNIAQLELKSTAAQCSEQREKTTGLYGKDGWNHCVVTSVGQVT